MGWPGGVWGDTSIKYNHSLSLEMPSRIRCLRRQRTLPSKTAIAEEEEGEVEREVVEQSRQLMVEQSRHNKEGREEVDTSARLEAESVLKEVDRHSIDGFNYISLEIKFEERLNFPVGIFLSQISSKLSIFCSWGS